MRAGALGACSSRRPAASWRPVLAPCSTAASGSPGRWGETLGAAAPMLLVALGTDRVGARPAWSTSARKGSWSIGAAFATYFGFLIGGPGPLNVVLLLGLRCARRCAVGRHRRRAPLLAEGARGAHRRCCWSRSPARRSRSGCGTSRCCSPRRGEPRQPQPGERPARRRQPDPATRDLFGNEFPISVFIAIVLAALVAFALRAHHLGLPAPHARPQPAGRPAGRRVPRRGTASAALLISGAFAGLAGAVMLAGGGFAFGNYHLVPGFSANIGWTGLLVALVARERALAAIPVAFVFAGCGPVRASSRAPGSRAASPT